MHYSQYEWNNKLQKVLNNKLKEVKMGSLAYDEETNEIAEDLRRKNITSDGKTADYYKLPDGATEIQDLISFKNMNAQVGEMFRGLYRYGQCSHSDYMREINKIIFYAKAEKERLEKYGGE